MNSQQQALFNALKESRFTATARILGEAKAKGAKVKIVNQPNGGAAWWDSQHKTIVLNSAMPVANDSKEELIYERAKLYHELFHVLFTTGEKLRKELALKSKDPARYMWVSNALEDGRIEYHGGKIYGGTTWYIRTILEHLVTSNSPDSGLLVYVRTKIWRTVKEGAFWADHQALIDEAITANNSSRVWEIAFEIVEAMTTQKPKENEPQGKPEPSEDDSDEDGEGESEGDGGESSSPQPNEAPENDENEEAGDEDGEGDDTEDDDDTAEDGDDDDDTEDGDSDSDEDEEDADSDDEDGDSGAGDGGKGEDSDEESDDDSEAPATPRAPTESEVDAEIKKQLEDMIDEAMENIDQEVEDELMEIKQEMATYEASQEYATAAEEQNADDLTEVFASLLVESSRQRYEPCKKGGSLDDRRLVETKTGGVFMHESIEKLGQPHIVLLLDLSYSMMGQMRSLSEAARMLNGAIQASGAKSIVITFGELESQEVVKYSVVPADGYRAGWSTPTHNALQAANEWLQEENARRGMVIVITDGEPNNSKASALRFDELSNEGFYVLDVLLDGLEVNDKIRAMCHDWVSVEHASELVRALEEPLDNFLSGSF